MASWYTGSGYSDIKSYSDQEIKNLIHSMGKRLNQRLSELEKQGLAKSSQAYSEAKTWAFDAREGLRDLPFKRDGQGKIMTDRSGKPVRDTDYIKPRFRTDVTGRTRKEMEEQLERMMKWESMKTSTRTGIMEGWYSRYKTSQQRGYKGTFEEYVERGTVNAWVTIAKIYGSDTADYCVITFGNEACTEYINNNPEEFEDENNPNGGMGYVLEQKMLEWYEANWRDTEDEGIDYESVMDDI